MPMLSNRTVADSSLDHFLLSTYLFGNTCPALLHFLVSSFRQERKFSFRFALGHV